MYGSCHVSITGKGNGTEEEWEEKDNRTTKQVGRFHWGQDLMSWVFLLSTMCCGGLRLHTNTEDVIPLIQQEMSVFI